MEEEEESGGCLIGSHWMNPGGDWQNSNGICFLHNVWKIIHKLRDWLVAYKSWDGHMNEKVESSESIYQRMAYPNGMREHITNILQEVLNYKDENLQKSDEREMVKKCVTIL